MEVCGRIIKHNCHKNTCIYYNLYTVPEPITMVDVRNSTSASVGMSSLRFVWAPQIIDPPIIQYELQFRGILQNGETWRQKNISGKLNSTVLEDLDPGAIYGVRMRAVSELGQGEWSPILYGKTYNGRCYSQFVY